LGFERTETTAPRDELPWSGDFADFWNSGRRYARRLIDSEADCEEIVQEVFCRLWAADSAEGRNSGAWERDRRQFAAMFFTSVRNLCIDRLRRRGARPEQPIHDLDVPQSAAVHPLELREQRAQVRAAIAELPDCWREALLLKVDGELSYDQIAEVLGCSKPQVRTWIFRARRQLAERLTAVWGASDEIE
jgi:RNA polymerase sigma-70 factor (ECF subfamily)